MTTKSGIQGWVTKSDYKVTMWSQSQVYKDLGNNVSTNVGIHGKVTMWLQSQGYKDSLLCDLNVMDMRIYN